MRFKTVEVGELDTNCYIVYDESKSAGIIIDPGADADRITAAINNLKIAISAIFITHGHYDHTSALTELAEIHKCPVYMHSADYELYKSFGPLIRAIGGKELYRDFTDYRNNAVYEITEKLIVKVIFTPGHSKGGVCIEIIGAKILFTGDTLFRDSFGRTDLPGGDFNEIIESLKMLAAQYSGYTVYPGHSESTTIDYEKQNIQNYIRGEIA